MYINIVVDHRIIVLMMGITKSMNQHIRVFWDVASSSQDSGYQLYKEWYFKEQTLEITVDFARRHIALS